MCPSAKNDPKPRTGTSMRREWTRGHVDTRATISRRAKGEGRGAQLTCANRAGGTHLPVHGTAQIFLQYTGPPEKFPNTRDRPNVLRAAHFLAPPSTRDRPNFFRSTQDRAGAGGEHDQDGSEAGTRSAAAAGAGRLTVRRSRQSQRLELARPSAGGRRHRHGKTEQLKPPRAGQGSGAMKSWA